MVNSHLVKRLMMSRACCHHLPCVEAITLVPYADEGSSYDSGQCTYHQEVTNCAAQNAQCLEVAVFRAKNIYAKA